VLLRWTHPERGPISPNEFIPVAEHTGLIRQLTSWVLNQALAEYAELRAAAYDLSIAINLSVFNLEEDDLAQQVATQLGHWKLPADRLVLEITESAVMSHPTRALRLLTELDEMGVILAVDDFGTGYSSLAYLKRLPVTELKIDKSFVTNMDTDSDDAVIVRSTVELARNLGMHVVAEGVETGEVWALLKALGCDTAQGYLVCQPMSMAELIPWMKHHKNGVVNITERQADLRSIRVI
jgi:EAL domain-containing protein (putative c-di-GMP-specific phosphodiesterase class I)